MEVDSAVGGIDTYSGCVGGGGGGKAAAAAAENGGWKELSLGDITSRAVALRQHFTICKTVDPRPREARIKIRPSVVAGRVLVESATRGGLAAAASARVPPRPSSVLPPRVRSDAPATTTRPAAVSAEVVERAERGGASFVAFADGRARGAFADRTIVTVGAPPRAPALDDSGHLEGQQDGVEGEALLRHLAGGRPRGRVFPINGEREGREVECVLPDGTVLRLNTGLMPKVFDRGVGSGCDGSFSPRLTYRGSSWRTSSGLVEVDRGGNTVDGRVQNLAPYVAAVCRFAKWAAAEPVERRSAEKRQARGRIVAAAEAERNRRFVTLQRVMLTSSPLSGAVRPGQAQREGTGGGLRDRCSMQNAAFVSGVGTEVNGDKENCEVGVCGKGVRVGGEAGRAGVRGTASGEQRNAIVTRLLEANRAAFLGRDALRTLEQSRLS